MPIIIQSKGLQHCRDIKRRACDFYSLTGGIVKTFKECIKIALEEHVKMLEEETKIIGRLNKIPPVLRGQQMLPLVPTEDEGPPIAY